MSPAARATLEQCILQPQTVNAHDKRWSQLTELQRGGFIRLDWPEIDRAGFKRTKTVRIAVTDAGFAAIATRQTND